MAATTSTRTGTQTTTDVERELEHLRQVTYLMDQAFRIPVVGTRIGVDALVGFVPVIGDFLSLVVGGYFMWRARRFGLPASAFGEMTMNIVADFAIGSIPVAGDVFDVFFKAHRRNLKVIERHLSGD